MNTPFQSWTEECIARWSVIGFLIYWAAYALVIPVTVIDSQTYNLGRLLIARDGGLFGNTLWNSEKQIYFPWSFDAIHYIFLFAGFGYALPSYFCFLGTLLIIHRLVKEHYGPASAWWCCLAMLALPTLMFQATSTKNDIPLVFGVACWFYALRFWIARRHPVYLALMALALGFTAGAKTTGLPLLAICAAWTFWQIKSSGRAVWQFSLFLFVSILLLGSVEIYLNNWLICKSLLGPASFLRNSRNNDGIRGAFANAIRYVFGLVDFGCDPWITLQPRHFTTPFQEWLAARCADLLRFLHLSEAGYRTGYHDENFYFLRNQWEVGSDYGPAGMLAIAFAFPAIFILSRKDVAWRLCVAGFLSFAIICISIAWMPWNMRFLLLPMSLFALAFTLFIVREKTSRFRCQLRTPFLLLLIYSAAIFPLCSFNKAPSDIWESITQRDVTATKECASMLEIVEDIKALPARANKPLVLLHAGVNPCVLPILQIPLRDHRLDVTPAPQLTEKVIDEAEGKAQGRPIYILVLDRKFVPETTRRLLLVKNYAEPDCSLFLLQQPSIH